MSGIQHPHEEWLNRMMDEYEWLMQRTQPNLENLLEWTITIPSTLGMVPAFPELEVDDSMALVLYLSRRYRILFWHQGKYIHPFVNEVW